MKSYMRGKQYIEYDLFILITLTMSHEQLFHELYQNRIENKINNNMKIQIIRR
jgi:hypothetical protein